MKKTIWARVGPDIDKSARMLAKARDISISEYVRRLIIQDLDSRNLLDLRKSVEQQREESSLNTIEELWASSEDRADQR